jgi:hypothetical protein
VNTGARCGSVAIRRLAHFEDFAETYDAQTLVHSDLGSGCDIRSELRGKRMDARIGNIARREPVAILQE